MQKARRDFLKLSGVTASAAALSGCASLDRWVIGDRRDDREMITIIGAGAAGLYAGYLLKQERIPFRIYEAQNRLGGRIWSLEGFAESGQPAELGAEVFHPQDSVLSSLVQEFRLDTEVSDQLPGFFSRDRWIPKSEFGKGLTTLKTVFRKVRSDVFRQSQEPLTLENRELFPKAVALDEMTAADLASRIQSQIPAWSLEFLSTWGVSRWGAPLDQVSALALVMDGSVGFGEKQMRFPGGAGLLTKALSDRVIGVVPGQFIRFDHRLLKVEQEKEDVLLTFQTAKGKVEILARNVLFTLPRAVMAEVTGLGKDSFLSKERASLITAGGRGQHSRAVMLANDLFWKSRSEIAGHQFYRAGGGSFVLSPWSSPTIARPQGIVSQTVGGESGVKGGLGLLPDLQKQVQEMHGTGNIVWKPEHNAVHNWSKTSWAKMSRSYPVPGHMKMRSTGMTETHGQANLSFIGEAWSLKEQGRLEGALQTAKEAVESILKKR